jgi:CopG family nickel-responsive transcriptional regulator
VNGREGIAMEKVARIGVSIEQGLLGKLDEYVEAHQYPNRSHAIRDLVRRALVEEEWTAGAEAVAAVVLLFDHHSRDISERLREVQHEAGAEILSTLHHHLSHERCLEIITLRGSRDQIMATADQLRGTRGVLHSGLVVSSTGRDLP